MQDHIEEHIGDTITLDDLSKAAGYSPYYSLRIFKELTGHTPFEYIRLYRLTNGAKHLTNGNPRIVDVASDCAFDTHEGFTRAFSKEFGIPPEAYKAEPVPVRFFVPYSVLIRYLVSKKEGIKMEKKEKQTIFTQVIERPKRKAIVKRGVAAEEYFAYCNEVGCDVWGILESVKGTPYEPAGFWLPKRLIKEGTSKYIMGVEVPLDHKGKVPEGFEVIELDPCKIMLFRSEPYDDADFQEVIADMQEAIEKFDPKFYGFEWADDDAPRFQPAPICSRGYIEARPVKQLN
jgi:AraC-like DNA-binding protein